MQYCTDININKKASNQLDSDGDCFIVLLFRTSQSMRKGQKKKYQNNWGNICMG